jgi:hypothetical protein
MLSCRRVHHGSDFGVPNPSFQNVDLEGYSGLLVIHTVEVSGELYNINYFVRFDDNITLYL